jgi:hypothetical protein
MYPLVSLTGNDWGYKTWVSEIYSYSIQQHLRIQNPIYFYCVFYHLSQLEKLASRVPWRELGVHLPVKPESAQFQQ